MAERIRAPNSSSGASVQQSVGSNLGRDTCRTFNFRGAKAWNNLPLNLKSLQPIELKLF